MTAVRGADDSLTLQREAAMRRGIRQAAKDGFTNVAVVCGGTHPRSRSCRPPPRTIER